MDSLKEKDLFHNTLLCLLKYLEGKETTVDLRNECAARGTLTDVDVRMNLCMRDVTFTDQRGHETQMTEFYIKGNNIRYVHIPTSIRIGLFLDRESKKKLHVESKKITIRDKKHRERAPKVAEPTIVYPRLKSASSVPEL